jgi:preprotein translocase subunit YajC
MGSFTTAGIKGAAASGPAATLVNAFPFIFLCVVFYMLIWRPQQRKEKERQRMVDALKVGDRVLTQGGMYGTVSAIREDNVQVKIADNVKAEFARGAITQVFAENANGRPAVGAGSRNS